MKGKVLNYYGGGNTALGFVHHFESNFQGLDRLYILKGGPGTGKSTLMKHIGNQWLDRGYDVDWIHCSSDAGSIDGVLIPKLKVGIVDGTNPHVIEPRLPGAVDDYVNLGAALNRKYLVPRRHEIENINSKIKSAYQSAYAAFKEGLYFHDQMKKIYVGEMIIEKANEFTQNWIKKYIPEKAEKQEAVLKKRFLGASTPDGPVNFIENLTEYVSNRFFIKGRAGTGKSTFLKKIAQASLENGFDTEIYYCGLDPKSLDMVIIRELDLAVFDSTAPHEFFPVRNGDVIIDFYELFVNPGTDEKYDAELKKLTKKYKKQMAEGTAYLAETKRLRVFLEEIYKEGTDFKVIDQIREEIQADLESIEKHQEI